MNEQKMDSIKELESLLANERTITQALFDIIMLDNSNIDIRRILTEHKISKVAIYGMGKIGRALLAFLEKRGISIVYCIDRDRNVNIENYTVYHNPIDIVEDVDIVIVTPELYFQNIKEDLSKTARGQVVLARDLLENILLLPQIY